MDTDLSLDDNILQGSVTGTRTLDANVSYNLTSALIVQNGAKLVIPAELKLLRAGASIYRCFKGGQIEIDGTADNPVVISSSNAEAGDWGGLTICGDATTSAGVDATAEVGGLLRRKRCG